MQFSKPGLSLLGGTVLYVQIVLVSSVPSTLQKVSSDHQATGGGRIKRDVFGDNDNIVVADILEEIRHLRSEHKSKIIALESKSTKLQEEIDALRKTLGQKTSQLVRKDDRLEADIAEARETADNAFKTAKQNQLNAKSYQEVVDTLQSTMKTLNSTLKIFKTKNVELNPLGLFNIGKKKAMTREAGEKLCSQSLLSGIDIEEPQLLRYPLSPKEQVEYDLLSLVLKDSSAKDLQIWINHADPRNDPDNIRQYLVTPAEEELIIQQKKFNYTTQYDENCSQLKLILHNTTSTSTSRNITTSAESQSPEEIECSTSAKVICEKPLPLSIPGILSFSEKLEKEQKSLRDFLKGWSDSFAEEGKELGQGIEDARNEAAERSASVETSVALLGQIVERLKQKNFMHDNLAFIQSSDDASKFYYFNPYEKMSWTNCKQLCSSNNMNLVQFKCREGLNRFHDGVKSHGTEKSHYYHTGARLTVANATEYWHWDGTNNPVNASLWNTGPPIRPYTDPEFPGCGCLTISSVGLKPCPCSSLQTCLCESGDHNLNKIFQHVSSSLVQELNSLGTLVKEDILLLRSRSIVLETSVQKLQFDTRQVEGATAVLKSKDDDHSSSISYLLTSSNSQATSINNIYSIISGQNFRLDGISGAMDSLTKHLNEIYQRSEKQRSSIVRLEEWIAVLGNRMTNLESTCNSFLYRIQSQS